MKNFLPPDPPKLLRSINNKLEFGKHKGLTVQQVMREDPNWLHWALQNIKDFKLNRNALLLLPPFSSTPGRRSSIEDGAGGFLASSTNEDTSYPENLFPETFNDFD